MKMTSNINIPDEKKILSQKNLKETLAKILNVQWTLKSIYETGLTSDEARYQAVDLVFSPFNIYALYGNRIEKYRYKFLSPRTFTIEVEGMQVKCLIKELTEHKFIFHADFKGHFFIIELEK